MAFGLIDGASFVTALGYNADIDATEDVWSGGGLYPWMTGATSLEILSASAADAAAGTGARSVVIVGLNAAYAVVTQTVTLNGVTPVAIPTSLFRINNAYIISAGSGQVNAGDITIRDAGAGTTRAVLPLGFGTVRQSQYTVPAGFTLALSSLSYGIVRPDSSRDVAVSGYVGFPTLGIYQIYAEISIGSNPFGINLLAPFPIGEKTDFGLRCTSVSATNTQLSAGWGGILHDNSKL